MRRSGIVGSAAVTALLLAFPHTPVIADAYVAPRADEGYFAMTLHEDFGGGAGGISRITKIVRKPAPTDGSRQLDPDAFLCTSVGKAPCELDPGASPEVEFEGQLVLPLCTEFPDQPCLEGLQMTKGEGQPVTAKYLGEVVVQKVAAQPEIGLPAGGGVPLWDVPGVPHAGGQTTYAVVASLKASGRWSAGRVNLGDLNVNVMPYSERDEPTAQLPTIDTFKDNQGVTRLSYQHLDNANVWSIKGKTGKLQDFDPETSVSVSMRLPNTVTGWLRGRLQGPEIKVEPLTKELNRLTVSGKVVTVPKFWGQVKFADVTPGMKSFTPPNLGQIPSNNSGGQVEGMFDVVKEFRPFVGDKAAGKQVVWAVANTAYRDGNRCLGDTTRLLGLVTTNAMVYAGGPPAFVDGFLEYKVAGMHYASNGELEKGIYDLQIRSDVARCLYGFSSAPVSATISVVSENGVQNVATTVFGEKDGWIRLGAYAFTFSSPTIRVTLSQEKPKPVVEPTTTPTTAPVSPVKKKTIVCIKGAQTKKISALTPKCPAGWRKK